MYTLNVTNNFVWPITPSTGAAIPEKGGTQSFDNQGTMSLTIPGLGQIAFLDLGDTKLTGYPEVSETWGVLVRTHSTEAYYRYEGGGVLNAVFDIYGTCTLSTSNGTLIPVSLEEMIVDASGLPIS